MAQSRQHRFSSVIHVRHLLCTIFVSKTACQNYFFSNPFPKKRLDCESQNSRCGFDPKNPPRVWILWIHDPFLDLPPKMQNPLLDSDFRIRIFPKKRTLNQQESNFARAAYFFVHFFAVFLHDYNVKRPETSYLSYNFNGENVVRVLFHFFFTPSLFHLGFDWWPLVFLILSPPLQNFDVVLPSKKVPFLFYLSLYISIAFFLIELRWPATYFLFFSVFLLRYIRNFVDMTINLSLILQTTRIQKQFPLSVFVYIDSLIVSALQDAGGYTIFLRNNLELIFGCYTC